MRHSPQIILLALALCITGCASQQVSVNQRGFRPLFPDQTLSGWRVASWRDVSEPAEEPGEAWRFHDGVLEGTGQGTWLVSKEPYGDFVLELDWRIDRGANAGVGLRFPPAGDPAYRGMEVQIVDGERYYRGRGEPRQRTGSIHNAVPASQQAANPPGQWNHYRITARGPRISVVLNGQTVVDVNLAEHTRPVNETGAPPLAQRPRTGRIGFQNLSGGLELRNIRIKRLAADRLEPSS